MKWFCWLRKGIWKTRVSMETIAQTKSNPRWRYCVIGNITKNHYDEQEILRYGTKAFRGGTKVYLCGKYWDKKQNVISVIGLNRYKCFVVEDVSTDLIENVRCSRAYKPAVLKLMENFEFCDFWWDESTRAKEETIEFVKAWNNSACIED